MEREEHSEEKGTEYKDSGENPPTPSGKMDPLTTTLYHELKRVAINRMSAEKGPQTLQATALVNEAWLRIGGDQQPEWESRVQFFSAAAEAMRRILVDRARRRQAVRHGGEQVRVDIDASPVEFADCINAPVGDELILSLHEALKELSREDPPSSDLLKLHYFAGLTVKEAAEALGLTKRTAERRLSFARAWLGREMKRQII